MRHLFPVLLIALLGFAHSSPVHAQCTPIHITWPADAEEPVWEVTALPPSLSTGPSGSGLEVRDVKFHGQMVLRQGHVPMINVQYGAGCGCFRDWASGNTRFDASNVTGTCFAQPPSGSTVTTCDLGLGVQDVGTFTGVAMEDHGESFTLISHSQAGWYRYTIKWTFDMDGTITPEFGFSHTPSGCATNPRWHNVYWRLDFDIDEADSNEAFYSHNGADWQRITQETTDNWIHPDEHFAPSMWAIRATGEAKGYAITPGVLEYDYPANPETGNPTIDGFAPDDIAITRFRAGQYTDGGGQCKVDFRRPGNNAIVRDEPIGDGADLVVWYRTGATRIGDGQGDQSCVPLGPTLKPLGQWEPDPPVGTETGAPQADLVLEAFPNPFDQSTTIRFQMEEAQEVRVMLYDALGREVRTVFEGAVPASSMQNVTIDGGGLPNGVYTVRVTGESGTTATTRIVLVR